MSRLWTDPIEKILRREAPNQLPINCPLSLSNFFTDFILLYPSDTHDTDARVEVVSYREGVNLNYCAFGEGSTWKKTLL